MTDTGALRRIAAALIASRGQEPAHPVPKSGKTYAAILGLVCATGAKSRSRVSALGAKAPRLLRSHPKCIPMKGQPAIDEAAVLAAAARWAMKRQSKGRGFREPAGMLTPALAALTGAAPGTNPKVTVLQHPAKPGDLRKALQTSQAILLYENRDGKRNLPEALSALKTRTHQPVYRAGATRTGDFQIAVYDRAGTDPKGKTKPRPAAMRDTESKVQAEAFWQGEDTGNGSGKNAADRFGLLTTVTITPAPEGDPETARKAVEQGEIYQDWQPRMAFGESLPPHPTLLIEPTAMAFGREHALPESVQLPARSLARGAIARAQAEVLARIQQAHEEFLIPPNGGKQTRKGFLLGEGAGCGKGRTIAATMIHGMLKGHRAVWFSTSPGLLEDARRDWKDLGGNPEDLRILPGGEGAATLPDENIPLFAPYSRIRKPEQKKALIRWLRQGGKSPVLAFDESHALGSSINELGSQGSKQGEAASQIEQTFPNARVLYASGTAFTSPASFAYASRLGLWASQYSGFAKRTGFLATMWLEGNQGLETVARAAHLNGTLCIRCVDNRNIEKESLLIPLTKDQEEVQDKWAKAWRLITREMNTLVDTELQTKPQGAGRGKGEVPRTRLLGIRREFFKHLINAFKTKDVIRQIRKDLKNGLAPIVQVESTMEAALQAALRRHRETEGNTRTLPHDTDISSRARVKELVHECFPVHETEWVEEGDEWICKKRKDANGRHIVKPQNLLARRKALDALENRKIPPFILDQLVWEFGDRLAEISGRSTRTRKDPETGELHLERRRPEDALREAREFQQGKRDVLIFTRSGTTGRSYHASQAERNPKRRTHYVVQMPEHREALIQGLGRSNRTGQVSAPILRFAATSAPGERRFISSAAANLEMMGAGCRGDTQAFEEKMLGKNASLEEPAGRLALRRLYENIQQGKGTIANHFTQATFKNDTGIDIEKRLKTEGLLYESDVRVFLNRTLALPIREQEILIGSLDDEIDDIQASGILPPDRTGRIHTQGAKNGGESMLPGTIHPVLLALTVPEGLRFRGTNPPSATPMLEAFSGSKNARTNGLYENERGELRSDWWHQGNSQNAAVWFQIPGTQDLLEATPQGLRIVHPERWTKNGNPVLPPPWNHPVPGHHCNHSAKAHLEARRAMRGAAKGEAKHLVLFTQALLPIQPFMPRGRSFWVPVAGQAKPEFGLACKFHEAAHVIRSYADAMECRGEDSGR